MTKYVAELIGTFFLVLTIGMTAGVRDIGNLAPIAIGLVLVGVIFGGGHLSAAHYNPAVTLAFWLRGKCTSRDVPGYLAAQILGAGLAASSVMYLADPSLVVSYYEIGPALLAEFLFTFVLVWVILNVATTQGTAGNPFYGVAIGATVTAGIYAVGRISGAVFNPAVAIALALMGAHSWSSLWLYFVATVPAAIAATVVVNSSDSD